LGVIWKRAFWPLFFSSHATVFYVWRMYAGESPIFVPGLWFSSYYNTRYGPLDPAGAGNRGRGIGVACAYSPSTSLATLAIAAAVTPWLIHRQPAIGSAGRNRR